MWWYLKPDKNFDLIKIRAKMNLKLVNRLHVAVLVQTRIKDMDLDLAYFPSGGTHKRVVLA